MKFCKLVTFILYCFWHTAHGQNLVPNWSFEEVITCPQYLGDIANTVGWYGSIQVPGVPMNENPSPDWYHTCSELDVLSPPTIIYGAHQEPLDGEGYVGIVTFGVIDPNYREYIGVELTEPLEIGQNYLIQFNIVRSPGGSNSVASNNLGVKFSTNQYYFTTDAITNNFSHFNIDTLLTDTTNWQHFSFTFTADSTYQFVHFGNFYTDENTNHEFIGETFQYVAAYYLYDAINITKIFTNKVEKINNLNFHIYPNPSTNGKFFINCDELIRDVRITDCMGNSIFREIKIGSKNVEINLKNNVAPGLYFVFITNDKGRTTIIKQIIT